MQSFRLNANTFKLPSKFILIAKKNVINNLKKKKLLNIIKIRYL